MGIRDKFVLAFGEAEALAFESAAAAHQTSNSPKGSDPFKWVLLMCIGFQCAELAKYRVYHSISAPWKDVKKWIKENADLASHDGSFDSLTLLCGGYDEYVEPAVVRPVKKPVLVAKSAVKKRNGKGGKGGAKR